MYLLFATIAVSTTSLACMHTHKLDIYTSQVHEARLKYVNIGTSSID
jgi:hypothetical protein